MWARCKWLSTRESCCIEAVLPPCCTEAVSVTENANTGHLLWNLARRLTRRRCLPPSLTYLGSLPRIHPVEKTSSLDIILAPWFSHACTHIHKHVKTTWKKTPYDVIREIEHQPQKRLWRHSGRKNEMSSGACQQNRINLEMRLRGNLHGRKTWSRERKDNSAKVKTMRRFVSHCLAEESK